MPHLKPTDAMGRMLRRLVLLSICVFAAGVSVAEERTLRVSVSVNDEDGIVALNRPVTFTARIRNLTDKTIQAKLKWTVQTVAFVPRQSPQIDIALDAKQRNAFTHQITMPAAGFAELVCEVLSDGANEPIVGRCRIGAEVESGSCELTRQKDFDQFWKASLAELKAIDPAYSIVKRREHGTDKLDVYEVTMTSHGNVRVRGWLEVPKKD